MTPEINGTNDDEFARVRRAFIDGFDGKPAMGAALCVVHHGRTVVDLWGGTSDPRSGRAWESDTANVIFSCTKGVTSLLVARLVQDGYLDYDALATDYWPEFGRAGKDKTLVRHLVSHRAGLSAPRVRMTLDDVIKWDRAVEILADEAPLWVPGEGWAYHALTHGWLGGELIRRASGRSIGAYFQEQVAQPLALDAWIGLPASEQARVAYLSVGPTLRALTLKQRQEQDPSMPDWLGLAMTLGGALPPELVGEGEVGFNNPVVRAAEVPGAGGIATARALATLWAAAVSDIGGVRLLEPDTLERALAVQTEGPPVFAVPGPWPRWGMGFQLDSDARHYLTPSSFGHDGAGGQVAFADPGEEIGFAYLTNWMEADDDRATKVIDALRECL